MRYLLTILLFWISAYSWSQHTVHREQVSELEPAFDDTTRLMILIELGNQNLKYFHDSSRKYYTEAMKLAIKIESDYWKGMAFNGMGNYFIDLGNYDSAMIYLSNAQTIFKQIGEQRLDAEVIGRMCYICAAKGEYNEALSSGYQSLQIAEQTADTTMLQFAYGFIGYVYRLLGDYDQAQNHLNTAIFYTETQQNLHAKAALKSELARVFEAKNDFKQAEIHFAESSELFNRLGSRHALAYAKYYLGESYRCQQKYNQAIKEYAVAYDIFSRLTDFSGKLNVVIQLGKAYIEIAKQGNSVYQASLSIEKMGFASVEELFETTSEELIGNSNKRDLLECYFILAEVSRLKGQYEKAYDYNDAYINLKDELQDINKTAALAEMIYQFDLQEQDRQLELLTAQAMANEENINSKRLQQTIIVIVALILIIIGFGLRHRIRSIRRIKRKLEAINVQLEKEKKRAEKGDRFKEKFLTNVSHEIRTPMNAIMGITNLLIKQKHYKDQEKYLEAMNISSRHLLGLINDILDLSKLESGKVILEENIFSLNAIITDIDEFLKPTYTRKDLYFNIKIDSKIPEHLIGDTKMLRQIVEPLCRNGIEYTEKGGVFLMVKLNGLTENMAILGITIKDTGIGIEKGLHKKLFSEVIGEAQFDKQEIETSGLELVLIRQMIELQGGSISIDSELGKGTTFYLELPYTVAHEDSVQQVAVADENFSEKKTKGLRILLVEDNEFNIMVAQEELEDAIEEVIVEVAKNGKIAIEMVSDHDYDIILMDVQMPVMNGYDASRSIRSLNGAKAKIPIIAMSANIMKTEIDKCYEAGMNGYIPKPFEVDLLIKEIYKFIK